LSLFSQLKLPPDGLSVSIVSFAKFFSLPLNPALLANVRRQSVSGESPDPAIREARALACLAAADKGLELSGESLERYARLISGQAPSPEPSEPSAGDTGENRQGSGAGKENFRADTGNGQGSAGEGPAGEGEGNRGGNQGGSPEALRKLAREAEAEEPLLGVLNRIPGRDGKRWLVIPIPLEDGEVRLYATLRLLVSPPGLSGASAGSPGEVEQISLEINGGRGHWFFSFRPGSILQAALWPEPGERERAVMEQELAAALGLPPGQVKISGRPVFAPDCRNGLFSVREEV
jgi:hypothetical protein